MDAAHDELAAGQVVTDTFTVDAEGAWSYTMDAAHDELAAGQVVTDTFTVVSADVTSLSLHDALPISGTNDAAVISTDSQAITESDVAQTVSGALSVLDVDSDRKSAAQGKRVGGYGTFTIDAAGAWSYTMDAAHDELAAGQVVTDTFTVVSADGTSKPAAVTVTITGTNDAAVISTDSQAITESDVAQTVSGALSVLDVDSAQTDPKHTRLNSTHRTITYDAAGA